MSQDIARARRKRESNEISLGARRPAARAASFDRIEGIQDPECAATALAPSEDSCSSVKEELRDDIIRHLSALSLPSRHEIGRGLTKERIRLSHGPQRQEVSRRQLPGLWQRWPSLLSRFADGSDVVPDQIEPVLVPVVAGTEDGELFRLATLLWSVPVSNGYGRRIRYLVIDRSNAKLIGLFALGDPVFNLKARDLWVGWTAEVRRERLVNVMDAYVVGSVPPYSSLLGGKLVAALIGSREVSDAFARKYGHTAGLISKAEKHAQLAMVTVTSALGRSSIYNRLHLRAAAQGTGRTLVRLERLGMTQGFGHFQLSDDLFERLREVVREKGHRYVDGHQFGNGPNWRMRLIRVGLAEVGLDPNLLRHGIAREVYAMELADNARAFLRGEEPAVIDRPFAAEIAAAAKERWIKPRANRRPEYREFDVDRLEERLRGWAAPELGSEPLGLRLDRADKLGAA